MSKIRLMYDGWLALPEAMRRRLGVATGDQLEVELIERAVILRPIGRAGAALPPPAESATAMPAEAEPAAAVTPSEPVRRGRGRPRKDAAASVILSPGPKARGRRAAATPAG